MKVCSIVGARPNFIKLAPLSKELRKNSVNEIIIHTGQHYDKLMSDVFFESMQIPNPNYNLGVQEDTHGAQIGRMMIGIEPILEKERPDAVIVFGDTNSTLAGAIVASKMNIPVAHIEAGCRSYDMTMPEETNRIMVDHIADTLYASTNTCKNILVNENVYGLVEYFGDVSVDIIDGMLKQSSFTPITAEYIIATIHRASNTNIQNLSEILSALNDCGYNVIFPVHPRTEKILRLYDLKKKYPNILFEDPMNYQMMIHWMKHAKMIVTDSGGIVKEAYLLKVPCITLRNTTEWSETLDHGWNRLTPVIASKFIYDAITNLKRPNAYVNIFGNVGVTRNIVESLIALYGA